MRTLVCTAYDVPTDTCTAQAWVEQQPSVFPPLTAAEGLEIAEPVLVLWAICFGLRMIARFIWR